MNALQARFRTLLTRFAPLQARWTAFENRLATLRERVIENWSRLTERDQKILAFAGTGGSILLAGLIVFLAANHLSTLRRDIDRRADLLEQVRDMRSEFRASKEKLDQINVRLRANAGPPRSFLEEKAGEVNVKGNIESMEERAAPPNDLFRAQVIEVRLKKVSLANLTRYLHKIESAAAGMSVRSLEVSPNFNEDSYVDARIHVQALRPKE